LGGGSKAQRLRRFAPQILDLAKSGDMRACEIAARRQGDRALANALECARRRAHRARRGFGEPLRPYLPPDVAKRLVRPRRDAVDGAILLAGGALDDAERLP